MMTRQHIDRLATRRNCPRCTNDKTLGMALCRRCRYRLPTHMRHSLEHIATKDESVVFGALRAAANYFDMHYRSVRDFGGGRPR
jgi:predicted amidophosphoribosyltransferase